MSNSQSNSSTKQDNNIFTRQLQNLMTEKIESIEKTPLNIAITGDSGTGKSTIINTLRGLRNNDPNAAQVGTVETTMTPTAYKHPNFPNVIFWDLPGVGTPKNPQATYKKRMNLKMYDFFIITISSRFTENTLWLAKTLTKLRKPYFMVRSKLDLEIAMKRKHFPGTTEHQVIEELRNDIRQQMEGHSVAPEIFILSGELEYIDRWDFPLLKKRIIDILPDVKKNTIIF
jgi:interferon gamma inducible protein 47